MSIPTPKPLHVDFSPVLNCRGSNYIRGGGRRRVAQVIMFSKVCVCVCVCVCVWGGGGHNNMRGFYEKEGG